MTNPYKIYDKNQGPGWLKQLDKYIVPPESDPYRRLDNEATKRNFGGDRAAIDEATYVGKKGK
jgi:hypothetical protein